MNWRLLTILTTVFIAGAFLAFANPSGPTTYSVQPSQRGAIENEPAANISAQAGNVTELTFNATAVTKNWQGYYGNISGKITLDNAANWTLYDWTYSSPNGRIYAARINSVTWGSIECMNFTAGDGTRPNVSTEETYMGAAATDVDGLDETFALANHPAFTVGTTAITANTCNSTFLYVNDAAQAVDFREVLLTDATSTSSVIYTAMLEQNANGFKNTPMDFELLVSENGHGNTAATPYYFWVELE